MRPDGARPCRITRRTADKVNVHLADLVSNAADVEFLGLKIKCEKLGNSPDCPRDLSVSLRIQLMQILDTLDLRHKNQPGKKRVVFQEQKAAVNPADFRAACCKFGMKGECHAERSHDRADLSLFCAVLLVSKKIFDRVWAETRSKLAAHQIG
jgi:hypothetical protein